MKNNLENQDIKTDKPVPMSHEALKADRDAQQKRADALAVENAGLKATSIKLFNLGYLHGHESTVEGYFVDVHRNDIDTYHDDVVAEILEDEDETPATSAALAAIRAKEHADFIAVFNEHIKTAGLDDDELVTVRECRDALKHANELREAK